MEQKLVTSAPFGASDLWNVRSSNEDDPTILPRTISTNSFTASSYHWLSPSKEEKEIESLLPSDFSI